jgi:hypothetical protein
MAAVADAIEVAIPRSSQDTASPSMMQDRDRSRDSASTISGKRWVRSLPGRLYSLLLVTYRARCANQVQTLALRKLLGQCRDTPGARDLSARAFLDL